MPSASKSQYKLMQFAAINAKFAEKKGIKQETAKEWHEADKKKKAEDPEWYENLPEKFEKKKDEGEVSTEGLGSFIGSLFHGGQHKQEEAKTSDISTSIRYDGRRMAKKTYLDEAWLNSKEFKTGPISVSDVSHKLNYPTIPTNLLDTTEKYIGLLGEYMIKYSTAVHLFANNLANKWDSVKEHATPEEAEKVIEEAYKKRSTIDKIPLPMHGLGNLSEITEQDHDDYSRFMLAKANPGAKINSIPALTKDQVRKVGMLIVKILDYIDKHDDLWDDLRTNHFDYKVEWRKLQHADKDADAFIHAMNLAGFEGTVFTNDDVVRNVLLSAAQALDTIATRSIK